MPDARLFPVLRQLRDLAADAHGDERPDAVLLERFTRWGDREALETLVRRYGPMVWRVCRRVLGETETAPDAFQATFLVLMRKARSIRTPAALAGWLHTTAFRIACTARDDTARRPTAPVPDRPAASAEPCHEAAWRELGAILEEEVQALPDKLRLPVLLCYWRGLTNEEAAQQLGWPSGTLKARLCQARSRLHQRLLRRGVTLPLGALALLLAPTEGQAALSGWLLASLAVLHGGAGSLPARAAALADLAARTAWHAKVVAALVLVLGMSALGVGLWWHAAWPVDPAPAEASKQAAAPAQAKPPEPKQARTDRHGDPLPPGALLRLGTVRHRDLGSRRQLLADGKMLLRTAGSKTEAVQDEVQWVATDTGRITDTWRIPDKPVVCGFSPDGRRVLVYDGKVFHLWDLGRRKLIRTFEATGEPEREYGAVFSHDAKYVATCRSYNTELDLAPIRVWDVHTGKPLWTLGKFDEPSDWLIGFVPGGPLMAFVHMSDMRLSLRDRTTGRVVRSFAPPQDACSFTLSPDGKACVIGTWGGAVRVWDLASGKECMPPLRGHKQQAFRSAVLALRAQFHHDGKVLLTGGGERTVLVWDWPAGRLRQKLDLADGQIVNKLGFSADGKRARIITRRDNAARWFDLATGKEQPRAAEAHNSIVWGLAVAADGRLVSTGYDDTFRVWDLQTGGQLQQHRVGRELGATALALSGDGRLVATAEVNGDGVLIQERDTGRPVRTIPTGRVTGLAFAQHRPLLAIGREDDTPRAEVHRRRVELLDTRSWKVIRRLEDAACPAFSPDGHCVAGFVTGPPQPGGNGQQPTIWDTDTGIAKFPLQSDHYYGSLVFSPDGRLLAAPSPNQVRLWEVASGQPCGAIAAPVYSPNCTVAFSPDSQRLAVPSGTAAFVYGVLAGRQLHVFRGHLRNTTAVAFGVDGRRLVSGSHDSTMLVWDVASGVRRSHVASTPTAEAIAAAWDDLAARDAKKAFHAVRALVAAPGPSVSVLRERLKPAVPVDTQRLRRWIVELDSEAFDTRDAATRALEHGGTTAEQAIRAALDGAQSLEARRRLEQILKKLWAAPATESLRTIRAIWALEVIDSANTRAVLRSLAGGAPTALQTREARAALARLETSGRR